MKLDTLVIGGGPAGSMCASLLAQQGLRVGLVVGPRPSRCWFELLSAECVLFLQRLGLDASSFTGAVRICPGILDTWHREEEAILDFALTRCSVGWVVERGGFDTSLVEFARSLGVQVIAQEAPCRLISSLAAHPLVVEIPETGHRIEAEFVVDATGITSRLMPHPYARRVWFDRLVAVRLVAQVNWPNADWMRLGSSSAGWWYTLPGFDGTQQAVFLTDGDVLPNSEAALRQLLEQQFADAFGRAPHFVVKNACLNLELRSARTSCRKTLWSQRWMPLGDAAYSLDPLSGGGLARALQMAEETGAAIVGFFATTTYDGLQRLAVQRGQEFAQNIALLRAHYAPLAERFASENASPFWRRRRPAKSLS